MELYSFKGPTLVKYDYIDKYFLRTVYHVQPEDFDAVLQKDRGNRCIRPQDWVFDKLEAEHPGLLDSWISVDRHAAAFEAEDCGFYEIVVMEDI